MIKEYYAFNGKELELKKKISKSDEEIVALVTSLKVSHPDDTVELIEGSDPLVVNPQFAEREKNILQNGINVIKEIRNIPLNKIVIPDKHFRVFKEYTPEMENAMQESIRNNGLFSPIILWTNNNGDYVVVSGTERVKAFSFLMEEGKKLNDENIIKKYETIPSFVFETLEITSLNAKQIYLESNLCTRVIDGETRVKAYSQYYMILKYYKERRNEYNIIDEMKNKFRVSKQTIYNYLSLNKLIEPLMYLFQEKIISFKSALKLSRLRSEFQEKVLEVIGLNNLNNTRIRAINMNPKTEKEFINNLKNVKTIKYPYWSLLKLKIPTKLINEFSPLLEKFVRQNLKYFLKIIYPKIRL